MASTLLTRGALIVDESVKQEASRALTEVRDESIDSISLVTSLGHRIDLPGGRSKLLMGVLERSAQGDSVSVVTLPDVLTTSAAADVRGVSRTTLMSLV